MKLELVLLQSRFHTVQRCCSASLSPLFWFSGLGPPACFGTFLVGPPIAQFYLVSALSYLSGFKVPRFLRLSYLTFLSLAWLNEARTGFITVQVSTQSRRVVAFPYLTYLVIFFLALTATLLATVCWQGFCLPTCLTLDIRLYFTSFVLVILLCDTSFQGRSMIVLQSLPLSDPTE